MAALCSHESLCGKKPTPWGLLPAGKVYRTYGARAFFDLVGQIALDPRLGAIGKFPSPRQHADRRHLRRRRENVHGALGGVATFVAADATSRLARAGIDPEHLVAENTPVAVEHLQLDQTVSGQFDVTDPFQRSAAECTSRRQILQMARAMREFGGEALKNIELTGAGTQMGVRETRRVKGLYVLTEKDAISGQTFDDVVAWRSGYLDIGFVRFSKMKVHDVPYRAILPAKLDGLLMAGRCISATHVAASAGKSMGNCVATGHAAGLAAAMSVSKGIRPRALKVAQLQDALRADGVDLKRGGKVQKNVSAAG